MKKAIWICVAALLAISLTWLLFPWSDRRWRIVEDEKLLARKQDLLRRISNSKETSAVGGRRPNVVILLADDLGKTDLGFYARLAGVDASAKAPTPHLDALASESALFTEATCTSPICAPSRAGLLTGRYPQRSGFEIQPMNRYPRNRLEYHVYRDLILPKGGDWIVAPPASVPESSELSKQGLPLAEITLADLLRASGYATGLIGKWHLGTGEGLKPMERGFDRQYGFYEAFSLYAPLSDPDMVESRHSYFADRHIWGEGRKGPCAIRDDDKAVEEKDYLTFAIAREANRFIRAHRDEPFLLYVPFSAPHTPFQAPRAWVDRFASVRDPNVRVYLALIATLDEAVGAILRTLREEGLDGDTIVVFASDNGGARYTGATDNAPLAGGKFSLFEGGLEVPLLVRWKGKVAPKRFEYPVSLLDVFSTALSAARVPLPEDRIYDGVDLLPWIRDGRSGEPHPALYWRSETQKAVRKGPFKLFVDGRGGRKRLFDLSKDRGESTDLSQARPEVVSEMESALADWEKGLQSPRWPRVMDYRVRVNGEDFFFAL